MKTLTTAVCHKAKKVGEVDVPVYESMEELIAGETQESILAMFNKANKIRIQGNERAKHAEGRTGKTKLRTLAFNLLTSDEVAKFAGDFAALQAFLDGADMQARVKEYIETGGTVD
jgi:hypothetical protein